MAGRMLLHLRVPDDDLVSACGVRIPPSNLTEIEDQVSCMSCQRHFMKTSRPYSSKRGTPGYGDAQFPGTGSIICALCGTPIRDHPGWPCNLRVDVV